MPTDLPPYSQASAPSHTHSNVGRQHSLFTEAEQKQLQLFLDGLDERDDLNADGIPKDLKPSPTHVILSSPYARNPSYGQQIQTPPLEPSNSRKRINGEKPKAEKRKIRALDRPSPAESSQSPSLSGSDGGSHSRSTDTRPDENGSPASRSRGGGRGRKPPHELLTEDQKKANHIASEQKRRANIRVGFDQLVDIVPTLSHCHRSESLILQKSADYIRQLIEVKNGLRDRARELQTALGEVPDEDSSEGEVDYAF